MGKIALVRQIRLAASLVVATLLVVSMLILLRQPELVKDPRFWAEEAAVYFKYAFQNGVFQAIITSHQGYFSLVANLGGAAASLLRIEDAPYATLILSFCIQVCPFVVLAISEAPYLKTAGLKAFSILFLFSAMLGSETWLNSVNSQFVMLTVGGLILSSKPINSLSSAIRCFLLIVLGLSGPGSIAFIPLFWLAAWQDASSSRRNEALAVTLSGVVQIYFLIVAPKTVARQFRLPLNTVLAWYVAGVEGKLLGGQQISVWLVGKLLGFSQRHSFFSTSIMLAIQIPAICFLYVTSSVEGKRLLLSSLAVAAVSAFGSINLGPERYALAPAALLGMAFLDNFLCSRNLNFWKISLGVALSCIMLSGAYDYFWAQRYSGPSWRQQVSNSDWDVTQPVIIWPDTWNVELSR